MNIKQLIKEAHENAVEHGFYSCPECIGNGLDISGYDFTKDGWGGSPKDCKTCNGTGKDPNKNIGELLMRFRNSDYYINNSGYVISNKYGKCRFLSQTLSNKGYLYVDLRIKKEYKRFYVHRLVSEVFLEGFNIKLEINHKDGIKTNNSLDNLEVCTHKENMVHCFNNGLRKNTANGVVHGRSKLTEQHIKLVFNMYYIKGLKQIEISKIFNVHKSTIQSVISRKTWKHINIEGIENETR